MHGRVIVLDLDLTLLSTQDTVRKIYRTGAFNNPSVRRRLYNFRLSDADGDVDIAGVIRPHTPEFLRFCFKYFTYVIVWSAGQRTYVEKLVDILFKDLPAPYKVYTYDDIGEGYTKPLSLLEVDLTKTLHLDDNNRTYAQNVGNGVHCPEYEPPCSLPGFARDDTVLLEFIEFLKRHVKTKDLSTTSEFF